jgi:hypothetical protein
VGPVEHRRHLVEAALSATETPLLQVDDVMPWLKRGNNAGRQIRIVHKLALIAMLTRFCLRQKSRGLSIRGIRKYSHRTSGPRECVNIRGGDGAVDVGQLDHIVPTRTGLVAGLTIAIDDEERVVGKLAATDVQQDG